MEILSTLAIVVGLDNSGSSFGLAAEEIVFLKQCASLNPFISYKLLTIKQNAWFKKQFNKEIELTRIGLIFNG